MAKQQASSTRASETKTAPSAPATPIPIIKEIRAGDTTKSNPFTICIVSNPALEAPWNTGTYVTDPIASAQSQFDTAVKYIEASLFGALPNQREAFVNDPTVSAKIRIVSLFISGLPATDINSLAAQDSMSNILVPRRTAFVPFLARYGLHADVAYAVSGSRTHSRASAWFTTDDDSRPGVQFTLDGQVFMHRYYCLIPGTIGLPVDSTSLTALHEFGHALSSYTNGKITDLYVDSDVAVNNKRNRPIPASFGMYNRSGLNSDTVRDGLGYPANWQSYHCELIDPDMPAVMDNYWANTNGKPEECQHDGITRQFLLDRLRAKTSR